MIRAFILLIFFIIYTVAYAIHEKNDIKVWQAIHDELREVSKQNALLKTQNRLLQEQNQLVYEQRDIMREQRDLIINVCDK
jgi:hypothetical protein